MKIIEMDGILRRIGWVPCIQPGCSHTHCTPFYPLGRGAQRGQWNWWVQSRLWSTTLLEVLMSSFCMAKNDPWCGNEVVASGRDWNWDGMEYWPNIVSYDWRGSFYTRGLCALSTNHQHDGCAKHRERQQPEGIDTNGVLCHEDATRKGASARFRKSQLSIDQEAPIPSPHGFWVAGKRTSTGSPPYQNAVRTSCSCWSLE